MLENCFGEMLLTEYREQSLLLKHLLESLVKKKNPIYWDVIAQCMLVDTQSQT